MTYEEFTTFIRTGYTDDIKTDYYAEKQGKEQLQVNAQVQMNQLLQSLKNKKGMLTIILNSSNPDLEGTIQEVGTDYVAIKIESSVGTIRYVPFDSICEFWFE